MCLFPMGGNGGMRGMNRPVVEPTVKGLKFKKILCATAILHLILAFMILWVNAYTGFNEMLSALILACGSMKMHFMFLVFYMVLAIFSFVTYVSDIGLTI